MKRVHQRRVLDTKHVSLLLRTPFLRPNAVPKRGQVSFLQHCCCSVSRPPSFFIRFPACGDQRIQRCSRHYCLRSRDTWESPNAYVVSPCLCAFRTVPKPSQFSSIAGLRPANLLPEIPPFLPCHTIRPKTCLRRSAAVLAPPSIPS